MGFFGHNGPPFGVLKRQNRTDNWIPLYSFDGTGPSGVTLDPTKGNIFVIRV